MKRTVDIRGIECVRGGGELKCWRTHIRQRDVRGRKSEQRDFA